MIQKLTLTYEMTGAIIAFNFTVTDRCPHTTDGAELLRYEVENGRRWADKTGRIPTAG
jgi:hypothetical protein